MSVGWNFPSNNNSEIIGIGEAGIETFRGSLFSSLAREICQNSLDARVDDKKPVKVEFALSKIKRDEIPGIDELSEAMTLSKEFWSDNKKTLDFFDKACRVCRSEQIRVLRISDYNTTGLTGSDKIKLSPWQDLVKSSGVSNKNGESGGSFGIGKSAPYACSDLRTIFYNTLDVNGLKAYQGVAKLVSFQYPDRVKLFGTQRGEITQGKGYYGETADNSAVKNLITFGEYERKEIGTDVYILGFIQNPLWKDEIVKATIEGYLISILQNNLEVEIDGLEINNKTINDLVERYKEEIPLTYNYYQVLTNENTTSICEDFEGLGKIELKILIQKEFRRKVLMARNNGMKIFDKQNISGTIPFAGICILKDRTINEYFREMENPQHNNWEPDRHNNEKEAKKMKQKLFSFIKMKVLEVGKSTVLDEMDAVGAGEFIPDIDSMQEAEKNHVEAIGNEVKDYSLLEKNENIKVDKGSQSLEDFNITGEIIEFGDISEDSDMLSAGYKHGNGHSNGGTGMTGENTGVISEKGNVEVKKTISIKPLKLRVFMCDSTKKIYKLSFVPERSARNAYIEIFAAGEQSNTNIEVNKATTEEKSLLMHNKNKIFIGNIEKGKKYSFLYTLKYNEVCSVEVVVHGYKI